MSDILADIKTAAERTAEGAVEHVESVPIVETFRGKTVWEGIVEVFEPCHPPPGRVYAWAVEGEKETQYVTVKGVPPADSPLAAVRVWLVSQSKK